MFGFLTNEKDGPLVRLDSAILGDFVQLKLVSLHFLCKTTFCCRFIENGYIINFEKGLEMDISVHRSLYY